MRLIVTQINGKFQKYVGTMGVLDNKTMQKYDELYQMPLGIYQVNLNEAIHVPYHWGTLVHFFSGIDYGSFLFITTNGKMYYRQYHVSDQRWYTDWQETATRDQILKIHNTSSTDYTSMQWYINDTDYYEYIFTAIEVVYRKNIGGVETVIWRK